MKEIWKPIKGYENNYEVSNLGRVKRISSGQGARTGRILKPYGNNHGYFLVGLHNGRSRKRIQVHKLVLQTFVGSFPLGKETNHIDGDKGNNCLDNLEMVTRSENCIHSYKYLNRKRLPGEMNGRAKLTNRQILKIRNLRKTGMEYQEIAEKLPVGISQIFRICHQENWKHLQGEIE